MYVIVTAYFKLEFYHVYRERGTFISQVNFSTQVLSCFIIKANAWECTCLHPYTDSQILYKVGLQVELGVTKISIQWSLTSRAHFMNRFHFLL